MGCRTESLFNTDGIAQRVYFEKRGIYALQPSKECFLIFHNAIMLLKLIANNYCV